MTILIIEFIKFLILFLNVVYKTWVYWTNNKYLINMKFDFHVKNNIFLIYY